MQTKPEMTRFDRVMAALSCKEPDRVPVVLSSIAFCIRYGGFRYIDALLDPDKHVAAQMKVLNELGTDAVWGTHGLSAFSIEALGGNMIFQEENPPANGKPIIEDNQVIDFDVSRITSAGRVPIALRAISDLKKSAGAEVAVMALTPSPYSLANSLRGTERLFRDFIRNPGFAHAVLESCTPLAIALGRATIEAGADVLWVAEPLGGASAISRKHYRDFAHPHNKKMFSALGELGARIVYHVCGDWNDRLDLAVDKVNCLHLGVEADIARVKAEFGHQVALMGNVRAVDFLYRSPAEIEEAGAECLKAGKNGGGFILSGDCGIPRDTPVENVRAMVRVARRDGAY